MKKYIILLSIVVIIIAIIFFNYMNYKKEQNDILKYNLQFEENYQKEIYGRHLTSIINKVINNNEKNNVEIGQDKRYIKNDTNSINVEIKMTDTDTVYPMEMLYNGGVEQFVEHYGNIQFKCTKIEYHKKTGRVSYLYFEQITE